MAAITTGTVIQATATGEETAAVTAAALPMQVEEIAEEETAGAGVTKSLPCFLLFFLHSATLK
jgi:hypothetical protein